MQNIAESVTISVFDCARDVRFLTPKRGISTKVARVGATRVTRSTWRNEREGNSRSEKRSPSPWNAQLLHPHHHRHHLPLLVPLKMSVADLQIRMLQFCKCCYSKLWRRLSMMKRRRRRRRSRSSSSSSSSSGKSSNGYGAKICVLRSLSPSSIRFHTIPV